MRSLPVMLLCVASFAISAVQAESAASYCNEMYPPDSYEAAERSEYIRDCMAAYGEDVPEQAPETQEYDGTDKYYDRSVEEYVDSVGTEVDPANDAQDPSEYDTDE